MIKFLIIVQIIFTNAFCILKSFYFAVSAAAVCRCIYSDRGDLCLDTKCHAFSRGGSRRIKVEPV